MNQKYKLKKPIFIISLDFELMWGVFDKRTIPSYGNNISEVKNVIPSLLNLFKNFEIHATWAAVGCLYYTELDKLKKDIPVIQPQYIDNKFSTYNHINSINPIDFNTYYSGLQQIEKIKLIPNQEIGTHTFSHYYCLESGQSIDEFRVDIKNAINIAKKNEVEIKSIVFPRNQYNKEYLKVSKEEGILVFRGNENNFLQKPRVQKKINIFIRLLRLMDSYINLTGHNIYSYLEIDDIGMLNIPASFFFRPYQKKIKILEYLKLRRLKRAMLKAAKTGSMFHLWWHPHNFGENSIENLNQLKELLEYYKILNKNFEMQSLNMKEIYNEVNIQ